MTRFRAISQTMAVTMALLLASCGGGGGGDGGGGVVVEVPPSCTPIVIANASVRPAPAARSPMAGVTVSGTITVSGNTLVDADAGDMVPFAQVNNSASSAQAIFSPVTLGGYISAVAGSYDDPANPFDWTGSFSADADDWYRLPLAAGQSVELITYDPAAYEVDASTQRYATRLDVFSVTDPINARASNTANAASKLLTVTASDEYFVRVSTRDCTGPYNYQLRIRDPSGTLAAENAQAAFVEGELLVTMKASALGQFSSLSDWASGQGMRRLSAEQAGVQHLQLLDTDGVSAGQRQLFGKKHASLRSLRELTVAKRDALRLDPTVAAVDLNYVRRASASPVTEPLYAQQWHYPQINLPLAWNDGLHQYSGAGATVAVIDTGVFCPSPGLFHSDLNANIASGYDFVPSTNSGDGDGPDAVPCDVGETNRVTSTYHGTHVAGTIAAAVNDKGVTGVAYGAELMILRVLGVDGSGTDADIIDAIDYARTHGADVINMSLGGPGGSTALCAAVKRATDAGVIVVAAAGNDGGATSNFPAACRTDLTYGNSATTVVSVGSVGASEQLAPYSNFGGDLVAPGGNMQTSSTQGVLSTWADDSFPPAKEAYAYLQGTSMATPHVAGVAALMIESRGSAVTASDFLAFIQGDQITRSLGGASGTGHGQIDAYLAVGAAKGSAPILLAATPNILDFTGLALTSRSLVISAIGGSVTINDSELNAPWLSIDGGSITNTGTYTVRVDKAGFTKDVLYSATLSVSYTAGAATRTLQIPVYARDPSTSALANAGQQYVLLTDSSGAVEQQDIVSASGGVYHYAFSGVLNGSYLVVSGSDLNNNGFICDPGESCAEYPVLNEPDPVVVSGGNVTDKDFSINFVSPLAAAVIESEAYADPTPRRYPVYPREAATNVP